MARLIESININCDAAAAWDLLSDVGALERMVPELVAKCDYDEARKERRVEFANGMVLDEPIIACDDASMTLVWTALGGDWSHHNASVNVVRTDNGCRMTWIADVLPDDQAPTITAIMLAGLSATKDTLEAQDD